MSDSVYALRLALQDKRIAELEAENEKERYTVRRAVERAEKAEAQREVDSATIERLKREGATPEERRCVDDLLTKCEAQRDAALDVCRDLVIWTDVNFPKLRGIHKRLLERARAVLPDD